MKKDYYNILDVKRSASDEDITTAYEISLTIISSYKKLALRHHPMKHPTAMKINLERFHELCESYQVLSDRTL
jgi:DnaJ-class molecular chaperone